MFDPYASDLDGGFENGLGDLSQLVSDIADSAALEERLDALTGWDREDAILIARMIAASPELDGAVRAAAGPFGMGGPFYVNDGVAVLFLSWPALMSVPRHPHSNTCYYVARGGVFHTLFGPYGTDERFIAAGDWSMIIDQDHAVMGGVEDSLIIRVDVRPS